VGEAVDPGYWCRHLRETVQFAAGIDTLKKQPRPVFVEIGPGRDLRALLVRHREEESTLQAVNLLPPQHQEAEDDEYLLGKIGQLWLYGVAVDGREFYRGEKRQRIPLPLYPFEKRRFWLEGNPLDKVKTALTNTNPPVIEKETQPEPDTTRSPGPAEYLNRGPEPGTPYVPPGSKIEEILVQTWQEFFGTAGIGIKDDFFDLGGDSLKASVMISRIHKELDVLIPLEKFFQKPTIEALAIFIVNNTQKSLYSSIESLEKKEYYPLSSAQRRLYVLWQLDQQGMAYNIPTVSILEGRLNKDRFEHTLRRLNNRHESLRTSFEIIRGEPVQRIHSEVIFNIQYYDLSNRTSEGKTAAVMKDEIIKNFKKPFDLSHSSLLRVGLIKEDTYRHILVVDMHHIISDGISLSILVKESAALYEGKELFPLVIQYKDYSEWQNKLLHSKSMKKNEEYWVKQFSGSIPVLRIKTDYKRPGTQDFEGGTVHIVLESQFTARVRKLVKEKSVTLYMLMLAVYNILFLKYSGQNDIVVGTGIAGRGHAELHHIIGMFVNMLPIRNKMMGASSFVVFLREVKKNVLQALANQDYQFDQLVNRLKLERNSRGNPLFGVVLQVNNMSSEITDNNNRYENEKLTVTPYEFDFGQSHFDLLMDVFEIGDHIGLSLVYAAALFKKSSAEKIGKHFVEILQQVVENENIKLEDITISDELLKPTANIFKDEDGEFGF
jgi:acyl carrier protein